MWDLCNIAWLRLEKGICRAKGLCGFHCRWVVGESLEGALLGWQKGYVFAKTIHLKLRKTPFQRSLPFAIICNRFCPIPLLFSGHQVFIWLASLCSALVFVICTPFYLPLLLRCEFKIQKDRDIVIIQSNPSTHRRDFSHYQFQTSNTSDLRDARFQSNIVKDVYNSSNMLVGENMEKKSTVYHCWNDFHKEKKKTSVYGSKIMIWVI